MFRILRKHIDNFRWPCFRRWLYARSCLSLGTTSACRYQAYSTYLLICSLPGYLRLYRWNCHASMLQLMFGRQEFSQPFWLSWCPSPIPELRRLDYQSLSIAQNLKWRRLGCLGPGLLFQRIVLSGFNLRRADSEWLLTILTSVLLLDGPSFNRQWRQYQLQVDIPRSIAQTSPSLTDHRAWIWLHTHLFRMLPVLPRCSGVCPGVRVESVVFWASSWELSLWLICWTSQSSAKYYRLLLPFKINLRLELI